MHICLSLTNAPNAIADQIDQAAVIRDFAAHAGRGFREYWYYYPTRPGSANQARDFAPMARAPWLAACAEAAKAGAALVPYIGGGANPASIPEGQALTDAIDAYRGSPAIACDQVADDDTGSPAHFEAGAILAAGFRYHPEGNSKAQEWIRHAVDTMDASPCAEWWLWDLPIDGAKLTWNENRYRLAELLDAGKTPTVIIGRDNNERGAGFPAGMTVQQWARKKIQLVNTYRAFSPDIRIVLRPTGIASPALLALAALD